MSWGRILLVALVLTAALAAVHVQQKGDEQVLQAGIELTQDQANFTFSLTNVFDTAAHLVFSSGQQFELVVKDAEGTEVYRFSDGRLFTMALIYEELPPGASLTWSDVWDLKDKDGRPVAPGRFQAEITVLARVMDGPLDSEQLSTSVEFEL